MKNWEELSGLGGQKGAGGNSQAGMDEQEFSVCGNMRAVGVIISVMGVPQIPAVVWAGFSDFAAI